MLVDKVFFDKTGFLYDFNKRFSSFAEKCPLLLRYSVVENQVLLYDCSHGSVEKPMSFPLDFTLDTKTNIKNIKDFLVEYNYPKFTLEKKSIHPLTTLEIKELMEKEHASFKEASSRKREDISRTEFRLEKVFNQDNRILVRQLTDSPKPAAIYTLQIPVTVFLRELYKGPEGKAANWFETKAQFVQYVHDVKRA